MTQTSPAQPQQTTYYTRLSVAAVYTFWRNPAKQGKKNTETVKDRKLCASAKYSIFYLFVLLRINLFRSQFMMRNTQRKDAVFTVISTQVYSWFCNVACVWLTFSFLSVRVIGFVLHTANKSQTLA